MIEAIKIKIQVESDTIKIPELTKFIGKKVEIILFEDADAKSEKIEIDDKQLTRMKKMRGKLNISNKAHTELRRSSLI